MKCPSCGIDAVHLRGERKLAHDCIAALEARNADLARQVGVWQRAAVDIASLTVNDYDCVVDEGEYCPEAGGDCLVCAAALTYALALAELEEAEKEVANVG